MALRLAEEWKKRAHRLRKRAKELHSRWELTSSGLRTALPATQAVEIADLNARAQSLEECADELIRAAPECKSVLEDLHKAERHNTGRFEQQLSGLPKSNAALKTDLDNIRTLCRDALRHLYKTARTGQWNAACQRAWEAVQKELP
jgi:phage shock protein A